MRDALRRLRNEEGIALVFALMALLVLGIALTSVIGYTTSNQHSANLSKTRLNAYELAEQGLNFTTSILNKQNAFQQATLPSTQGTATDFANVDGFGGDIKIWGTLDKTVSPAMWTVHSVGTALNKFGSSSQSHEIIATIKVRPKLSQDLNAAAWDYVFSTQKTASAGACDVQLNNSTDVEAPFYVAGNFCFNNSGNLIEASKTVNVTVLGQIIWSNNASGTLGTSSQPVSTLKAGGSCVTQQGQTQNTHTCSPHVGGGSGTDAIYTKAGGYTVASAADVIDTSAYNADFTKYYSEANPGPAHGCATVADDGTGVAPTASPTNAPTFDNNYPAFNLAYTGAGVNGSTAYTTAAPFNLTPSGTNYNCIGLDDAGHVAGQLKWNSASNTLYIKGVVYIDGSITISNSSVVTYQGSATLYITGTFTMASTKFCAAVSGTDCDFTAWNPSTEMLIIATNGTSTTSNSPIGNSVTLSNSAHFQGGIFATNNVSMGTSAQADGPMIANSVVVANSVKFYPLPGIDTLPLGAPGNNNTHATPDQPQIIKG
jgi:Tfp pilus assembly protein PilV